MVSRDADDQADTRHRLIAAMLQALQECGYHGIGLTELLARAGAPKGVLYHHFPGGKQALALAAIEAAAGQMVGSVERALAGGAPLVPALRQWLAGAGQRLARSGYATGCPLAAIALETRAEDAPVRQALDQAFGRLRGLLAARLATDGLPPPRAEALATLLIAAYEGGLIQSRVAGDAAPMQAASSLLLDLVQRELDAAGPDAEPDPEPRAELRAKPPANPQAAPPAPAATATRPSRKDRRP